eukprot:3521352-Alexandrium_andersonii.AAC.1
MGHVKHGPICKHAGAVLLALAAEQCEKVAGSHHPACLIGLSRRHCAPTSPRHAARKTVVLASTRRRARPGPPRANRPQRGSAPVRRRAARKAV